MESQPSEGGSSSGGDHSITGTYPPPFLPFSPSSLSLHSLYTIPFLTTGASLFLRLYRHWRVWEGALSFTSLGRVYLLLRDLELHTELPPGTSFTWVLPTPRHTNLLGCLFYLPACSPPFCHCPTSHRATWILALRGEGLPRTCLPALLLHLLLHCLACHLPACLPACRMDPIPGASFCPCPATLAGTHHSATYRRMDLFPGSVLTCNGMATITTCRWAHLLFISVLPPATLLGTLCHSVPAWERWRLYHHTILHRRRTTYHKAVLPLPGTGFTPPAWEEEALPATLYWVWDLPARTCLQSTALACSAWFDGRDYSSTCCHSHVRFSFSRLPACLLPGSLCY